MGMPSWPLRRTRTPPCFQANHEGSHVDDVSERMLAEHGVTCSRRVHGCAVTNFSISRPTKGQSSASVTGRRTRQRDAARMELGVLFKTRKITPGFVAKQH